MGTGIEESEEKRKRIAEDIIQYYRRRMEEGKRERDSSKYYDSKVCMAVWQRRLEEDTLVHRT